jgi:hypothetical protein
MVSNYEMWETAYRTFTEYLKNLSCKHQWHYQCSQHVATCDIWARYIDTMEYAEMLRNMLYSHMH